MGARPGRVAQLQMRDVSGQLESRVQLLNIKSSNKVNWVSLAVAHRMAGNYELAWQVSFYSLGLEEDMVTQDVYSGRSGG